MDGGIFSCNVKLIKPNKRIYEKLFDMYNLIPSECVFIDDNPDNIKTANELSLNTIHFCGYDSAHAELEKLLND
jgi:putative hydrolase of the HAD superfamily